MGREAVVVCQWKGQVAEVKALLEAKEIILRGEIRARIARGSISDISVDADDLILSTDSEPLVLELGQAEAEKWKAALLKPPPTLAQKMGIDEEHKAFFIGETNDAALTFALASATTTKQNDAALLIAIIASDTELHTAFAAAEASSSLPIWFIYTKGKAAPITDAAIRTFMRGNDYIDSKSCAVSETLTATRYARKR